MKERGWLDEVTGLPNQAMMHSHLRETLGTFTEVHIPFGVVCLEVHDLGQFRARYGQEAARSMLQVLARTLRNTVWPTDFVGRWSENRFLVILMGCSEDALQAVSQRMLRMTAPAHHSSGGEKIYRVAVSIGAHQRPSRRYRGIASAASAASLDTSRVASPHCSLAGTASSSRGVPRANHVRDYRHRRGLRLCCGRLSDGARKSAASSSSRRNWSPSAERPSARC